MNEQWAFPQNNNGVQPPNGTANGMLDGHMYNGANDFSQLQNGAMRNASPAFQTPQYNVNQVLGKRPRPSEDSVAQSPRQPPNNLSRSQTPHTQGGFHAGFPGGQAQPPNPYQHLQQGGSGNATPSPTIQDAQFRPPTATSRMHASPSPFPTSQPGMAMSPPPDANGNRVSTPHNPAFGMNGMGMPPSSMPQAFNQNFGQSPMPGANMPQLSENLQQRQMQANQAYQMRMRAQQHNMAQQQAMAMAQGNRGVMGNMAGANNMAGMAGMAGQNPNMSTPTRNPQQMQQQQQQQQATFMRNLMSFMQQQQKPLEQNPTVCGRPINIYQLYMYVMKSKGSAVVESRQQWPGIAQVMGFNQNQQLTMQAGQELQQVYQRNLAAYESAYWRARQSNNQNGQQQQQVQAGQQMSPTRQMTPSANNEQHRRMLEQQYLQQMTQNQGQGQQPQQPHMTPVQSNANLPATNGWSTPQSEGPGIQRQGSMSAPNKAPKPEPSPAISQTGLPIPSPAGSTTFSANDVKPVVPAEVYKVSAKDLREGTHYDPRKYSLLEGLYGGYPAKQLNAMGLAIDAMEPDVPEIDEMGIVDIQALCMSLQSGLEAEIRYALDHLTKCSHNLYFQLALEKAPDLVDVLIDCAEEQMASLKEEAEEVSDAVDLTSYEELYRQARAEVEGLYDIPEFGTTEHELGKAADRTIAILTILRNLSFNEHNHQHLATDAVIKYLSAMIRLIGTREKFLRTHTNTQDFMKDVVTLLSNIAASMELTSREDAFNILNFLLAFAPQPSPASSEICRFGRFSPGLQKYLPPAVDVLAKLLARDEPNRAHCRYLFHNDSSSENAQLPPHQRYELITRAFGLAISVIPDRSIARPSHAEYRIAEVRKPYLIQGMLAADILATLVPNSDCGLARTWLEAEDGWAPSLLRLACTLSTNRNNAPQPAQGGPRPRGQPDHEFDFGMVTHRSLGMLQKLGEKTKNEILSAPAHATEAPQEKQVNGDGADDDGERPNGFDVRVEANDADGDSEDDNRTQLLRVMADVLPQREVLLGALLTANIDAGALRQLCTFAALEA